MRSKQSYSNIDMEKTGKRIRHYIESAGYTPKMIQEYLHLSCVQPIYRWYKGIILPSVDHLLMLSELLDVHMEELLVKKNSIMSVNDAYKNYSEKTMERYILYYKNFKKLTA